MLGKIITFIFGLCVGSFLNVCIYRLPKNISIIKPASFCPKCRVPIKWYDNIPLLSYIFLQARCRNCREKISFRYPLVEFITALLFLALYLKFGLTLQLVKFIFLFCLLLIISFIDIDYHAAPAPLFFMGITAGLIFSVFPSFQLLAQGVFAMERLPIILSLKGLIFGLGFVYLFKILGDFFINFYLGLRKKDSIEGEKESLGLGDVDFMGMVGAFLGVKAVVFVFFLAPFLALGYALFALIFKKSHIIPYLPYLSLATLAAFFFGDKILGLIL